MHQETVTLAYGISFIRAKNILQGFHMENQEVTGVLRQTKTTKYQNLNDPRNRSCHW